MVDRTAIPDSGTRALARELASLRSDIDQIKASLRSPQLSNSSIENGTLAVNDGNGTTRAVIGLQPDGNFASTSVNNPNPPPVPRAPSATPTKAGVQVGSNGPSVGTWPSDLSHLNVYFALPGQPGLLGGSITPEPGVLPIAPLPYVLHRFWLTSVNHSGRESGPSPEVTATPAMVVNQDVIDGIVTETKIAAEAVSQAKLALQAVGTGQIAGQAVTLSQLADGSVNAAKILDGAVTPAKVTFTARDIGSIANFYQATAPTSPRTNDLWVDTSSGNKLKQYNGTTWVIVQDAAGALAAAQTAQTNAAVALNAANSAQATADGKVTTFYQATAPTASASRLGDLWLNTSAGNKLYRYSGSAWVQVDDAQLATALANAATAQSTADGKIDAFYQATAPTSGMAVGDLWYDTSNGNLASRWNGTSWVGLPVGTNAISSAAIVTTKIANAAVTVPIIAANAVTPTALAGSAVTGPAIAANAVTAAANAANTITAGQLATGSVTATQIAANAVTAGALAANSVTAAKILANTITAGQLATNTVTSNEIAANTITASEIAANTITAGQISASAIGATQLAANSVIAGKVAASSITSTQIAALTIAAGNLAADSVAAGKIATDAVTAREIKALSVTAEAIAANAVTAGAISAGAVTADKLAATLVLANTLIAGTQGGARVQLNGSGIQAYRPNGTTKSMDFSTSTGNLVIAGQYRSSDSGSRVEINSGGSDPDTIRHYPSSGTAYAQTTSTTAVDGSGAILMQGSAAKTGRLGAYNSEAFTAYVNSSGISQAAASCGDGVLGLWAVGAINLYHVSTAGAVGDAYLRFTDDGQGNPTMRGTNQGASIKFASGLVLASDGTGNGFVSMKAVSFIQSSGRRVKRNIRDLKAAFGARAIDVATAARPKQYDYDEEHEPPRPARPGVTVRQPRLGPDGEPIKDEHGNILTDDVEMRWPRPERARAKHIGLIAEDVAAVAPSMVVMSPGPDGADEVSLDVGALAAVAVGAAADVADDLAALVRKLSLLPAFRALPN